MVREVILKEVETNRMYYKYQLKKRICSTKYIYLLAPAVLLQLFYWDF